MLPAEYRKARDLTLAVRGVVGLERCARGLERVDLVLADRSRPPGAAQRGDGGSRASQEVLSVVGLVGLVVRGLFMIAARPRPRRRLHRNSYFAMALDGSALSVRAEYVAEAK
jgi:hypothetical protein